MIVRSLQAFLSVPIANKTIAAALTKEVKGISKQLEVLSATLYSTRESLEEEYLSREQKVIGQYELKKAMSHRAI